MGDKIAMLQEFLDKEMLRKTTDIKVLEAGCGSLSRISIGRKAYTVGIDISEKQLQRNMDLHEKIVGDIQHHRFPPSSFDIIICWDVLEHLADPELALHEFARALRKGGMMVLKMPNVLSLKGLVTKLLPYPLHVLFYRHLMRRKDAGREDTGPFRTYLRFSITPGAIRKFADDNGLRVAYYDTMDITDAAWFQQNKTVFTSYRVLRGFVRRLSFDNLNDSDFIIVLQKTA